MPFRVLTWNMLHGRDSPPEPDLFTWRSRLFGATVRGQHHAQVNRDLRASFTDLLRDAAWDIALLQECPPRWAEHLAWACDAEAHLAPTSRNLPLLGSVQAFIADRNPDLIASWEGGSNLTLVRPRRWDRAVIRERLVLRLATRPERRVMAVSHLEPGILIGNLHASTAPGHAATELLHAARTLREWGGGAALLLGGDFNVRPAATPSLFETLRREHGLTAPTGPQSLDHLLVAGLEVVSPPQAWPPERREVTESATGELAIRLSDHAPVEGTFRFPGPAQASAH